MNDFASIEALEYSIFRHDHECRVYPNWMLRYFESLTGEEQWHYSLAYHKVKNQLVSEQYLVEQLKWILKWPKADLEYGLFIQFMFDPEHDIDDVFKRGRFEIWHDKYNERFEEEFSNLFEIPEASEDLPDDITGELPF